MGDLLDFLDNFIKGKPTPDIKHLARMSINRIEHLQAHIAELVQELAEEKESHKMTYSLMKSGEQRGVQKAAEELQPKIDQLAATVERFVELRDYLPNVRQWVIEFEKLVHKAPQQNLNAVKREAIIEAILNAKSREKYALPLVETTELYDYANTKYPVGKDGE